jgi:hypothetical protein
MSSTDDVTDGLQRDEYNKLQNKDAKGLTDSEYNDAMNLITQHSQLIDKQRGMQMGLTQFSRNTYNTQQQQLKTLAINLGVSNYEPPKGLMTSKQYINEHNFLLMQNVDKAKQLGLKRRTFEDALTNKDPLYNLKTATGGFKNKTINKYEDQVMQKEKQHEEDEQDEKLMNEQIGLDGKVKTSKWTKKAEELMKSKSKLWQKVGQSIYSEQEKKEGGAFDQEINKLGEFVEAWRRNNPNYHKQMPIGYGEATSMTKNMNQARTAIVSSGMQSFGNAFAKSYNAPSTPATVVQPPQIQPALGNVDANVTSNVMNQARTAIVSNAMKAFANALAK